MTKSRTGSGHLAPRGEEPSGGGSGASGGCCRGRSGSVGVDLTKKTTSCCWKMRRRCCCSSCPCAKTWIRSACIRSGGCSRGTGRSPSCLHCSGAMWSVSTVSSLFPRVFQGEWEGECKKSKCREGVGKCGRVQSCVCKWECKQAAGLASMALWETSTRRQGGIFRKRLTFFS